MLSTLQEPSFEKALDLSGAKLKMPSILSKDLTDKILGREWSFGYNCYEVGHTW